MCKRDTGGTLLLQTTEVLKVDEFCNALLGVNHPKQWAVHIKGEFESADRTA